MNRWSLRNKSRISYCESIEPPLDSYVYCDKCVDFVYEYCSIHGPLLVVPDDEVPQDSQLIVPRAALTIPRVFLHIAHSYIPGAGLGVFSSITLPSGVRFGPFCGVLTTEVQSNYCWQIYDNYKKTRHVVDAADLNRSNWMRYVNCSRNCSEQNLIAYQYKGEIYYRTIKLIPPFTELLVFYGGEFASSLHINLKQYNNPNEGRKLRYLTPKSVDIKTNKNPDVHASTEIGNVDKENYIDIQCHSDTISIASTNESKEDLEDDNYINVHIVTNNCNLAYSCSADVENEDNTVIDYNLTNENSVPNDFTLLNGYNDDANGNNLTNDKNLHFVIDTSNISSQSITQNKTNMIMINDLYTCMHCDFKRPYKKLVSKHILINHKEKCFSCDNCNMTFVSETNLQTHKQSHTETHSCNECSYKTTRKHILNRHSLKHSKEKLYTCHICQFKTNYIKRHLKTHENWYKCSQCEFKCKNKVILCVHLREHTNMKLYKCSVCYYNSPIERHLKYHLLKHKKEEASSHGQLINQISK